MVLLSFGVKLHVFSWTQSKFEKLFGFFFVKPLVSWYVIECFPIHLDIYVLFTHKSGKTSLGMANIPWNPFTYTLEVLENEKNPSHCLFAIWRNIFYLSQCGNCENILTLFGKNFVKVMVILTKLLNNWFDEIFPQSAFLTFFSW